MERLEQQIQFILEIDKIKSITRQTYLADGSRKENDAEHSWHLAVMCVLLGEYANSPVDVLRVMKMVLVHDLVEIDAGDTYAYDEAGAATQHAREEEAARRIFGMLPEDQGAELYGLWQEFEAQESGEAKFAAALDRFQPVLLNHSSGGKSWREHQVRREQVMKRNRITEEGARQLFERLEEIIGEHVERGNIRN